MSISLKLGDRTHIMGVINVTPDSFYDGGKFLNGDKAIKRAWEMVEEGADIVDIGGESTRPGAGSISEEEELKRVIPVIEKLVTKDFPIPISIDTYKARVAQEAVSAGASLVNDISGLKFDSGMARTVAKAGVSVVLMHTRGKPADMQKNVSYDSLFGEIIDYLKESIALAEAQGVSSDAIIVDPGIGFGKSPEDNLRIIKGLSAFKVLGKPVLVGPSRKSFIGKVLDCEPEDRLEGSLAASVIAVMNGADILRVHDVKATKKAAMVADAIKKS